MAIARAATEYMFSDFVLKEPASENKYKGIRLELALDKIVSCVAVGLPLLLISLAFAQEVSVGEELEVLVSLGYFGTGTHQRTPLDVHRSVVSHQQSSHGVRRHMWIHTAGQRYRHRTREDSLSGCTSSVQDLTESFKYPLVEQYLRTKRFSRGLLIRYLLCRSVTALALILACIYLCYYIRLSITDEFECDIRSGVLLNDTSVPPAVQCKLVAVGIFQLLSYINLCVYLLLLPICLYAMVVPFRRNLSFLKPYELLPTIEVIQFGEATWDDLALYLLFLEENLSELKSFKCLKVLELLKESGDEAFDTLLLLQTLGQVKTDVVDARMAQNDSKISRTNNGDTEMKEMSPLLKKNSSRKPEDEKPMRQRVV
ncbi:hypothetical protein DNTS_029042 [Danionella cerebrum]|uniref:Pannexin n=1 Tax=Danionella cerebrum TaxID=2873325 RepID=A0A553QQ23_9TELE|nr:hypothetical protein DNTS_029042 [Danionella translucida]